MSNQAELSQAIATVERQISEAKSEVAKKSLNAKLERLKEELKSGAKKGTSTLATLSSARKSVRKLASKDFTALIEKLSKKPEYAFLKGYSEGKLKDDLARVAKPMGYRFVGDNTKKPTIPQIKKGLKDGTVYYEARPIRSDVSRVVQLGEGGSVGTETIDLKFYNIRGQVVESGKVIIDYDNETITLASGKTYKVEPDREYTYRFLKTKIRAVNGIKGLSEFLKDINAPKKALNTVVRAFIDSDESKMATGGRIDLFEDYENIPANIQEILDKYSDAFGGDGSDMDYKDTANMLKEFEAEGYTFDYGLDNEPFGLRPIGVKLNELRDYEDFDDDKMAKGGTVEDCIDYIKNSESIKNNGYYLHINSLNKYVDSGAKIPQIKPFCLITFNSGGQNNLKAIDTINATLLSSEIAKLLNIDIELARIIVSEQTTRSKRFTMDMLDTIKNNNIIVADRETIVCTNLSNKFAKGGGIEDFIIVDSYWSNKKDEIRSENAFAEYIKNNPIKNVWIGLKKIDNYKFDVDEDTQRMIMRHALKKGASLKYYVSFLNHSVALKNNNAVFLQDKNYEDYDNKILTKETLELLNTRQYAQGGGVDSYIEFRKLAKSNNFDIVVAEGRYEVELDANDKVKSIVHPNGNRHKASECPIYNKYKKEINHYIMKKYAEGGNIASFNWKNFTLKELSEALPTDVEIVSYDTPTEKDQRPYNPKNKKFYTTKKLTIGIGEAEISRGDENIYLEITCYDADNKSSEEYEVKIYSKENHKGLKEVANAVIEKMKHGGTTKPHKIGFYIYETKRIFILWKGIKQPFGHFFSAKEALEMINKVAQTKKEKLEYKIYTPDGTLDVADFIDGDKMATGGTIDNSYLGRTSIGKSFYGWKAETSTTKKIKGYDWQITTMKRYGGELVSTATGGKSEKQDGYSTFEYSPFEDPNYSLIRSKPKMVNEKAVTKQHEEALKIFIEKMNEMSGEIMATGGGIEKHRLFNFLQDDLATLQEAIKISDKQEIERFFSYWGRHLKSLKSESNEKMFNFLSDDLATLETAIKEKDQEEIDKFFSYWGQHLESIKYATGGKVGEKTYNVMHNVGKSKYAVTFHDGANTHSDGSPFFDMKLFQNLKGLKAFTKKLESEGYKKQMKYGGKTKSQSTKSIYIETIAGKTGLRTEAIETFVSENNLSDKELLNLVQGIGTRKLESNDLISAVVGIKGNKKISKVVAFAKSDKAFSKMADGGTLEDNLLPPSKTYGENLAKAMEKFDISNNEARKRYGLYTIKQWSELLGEKMENGGEVGDISKSEIPRMQKITKLKGLYGYMPSINVVYYDSKSDKFYFQDFEGDYMEVRNISTLEQLDKFLKENNITLDKKMATGGGVKASEFETKGNTIYINGTKADVKKMYLDYVNNFLTIGSFADHYGISDKQASLIIENGREYAKKDGYYATGGSIPDNYEGRTPEDIWNSLSKRQRQHFLYDHLSEIEAYKNTGELPSSEIIKAYNSEWSTLDKDIKNRFTNHTREGQYATGGSVGGKKYSYLPNEDISKIVLKSKQVIGEDRILDGAYVKSKGKTKSSEKFSFPVGSVVWDKTHKRYGVVLNNFGNEFEGDGGEIRLDSDGVQPIFEYDKKFNRTEKYNLVPYGSKDDKGDGDLLDIKESGQKLIDGRKERGDEEYVKYYQDAFGDVIAGKIDGKPYVMGTSSNHGKFGDDNPRLVNFDIDDLDQYEEMVYNDMKKSNTKAATLQVIINTVEGDYTQLSPELAEIAEEQFTSDEWDEESNKRYFATGGNVRIIEDREERLGRPESTMEIDILSRVHYDEKLFVGNFGWRTPSGKLADGYFYALDDFDKNLVKSLRLKNGEKIYRYFNRTTAIGGMSPLIKINVDKGLLYFAQEMENPDNDEIKFEMRGTKAEWMSLIKEKYAQGGGVSPYYGGMSEAEILKATVVYDNGGETLDRYTVFTPDSSVFGMSATGDGFNQYIGDDTEIEKGSHLGKRLKTVPKDIKSAVLNRMKEEFGDGGMMYADGGSVNSKYYTLWSDEEETIRTDFDKYEDALSDFKQFENNPEEIELYEIVNGEEKLLKTNSQSNNITYLKLSNSDVVVEIEKRDGKWVEGSVLEGEKPYGWGGKTYMDYLKPNDIVNWLNRDYKSNFQIIEQYAKGGSMYADGGKIDYYELQDLKNEESILVRNRLALIDSDSEWAWYEIIKIDTKLEDVRKKIEQIENKMAKGGNTGYAYVPNADIEKIVGKDGKEYGQKMLLDGAYVKDNVRTPKMSRTQFEDDVYAYGEGGGVDGRLSYQEFSETLRDNDTINGYTGQTTKGMEMFYLPSGHPHLGKKFSHKNKRKAYKEYLESSMFATGGAIEIQKMKKEKEKMVSELFEKCGVFFAFSEKQFEENKTPLKEGEKYVAIGGGGYLPKGKVKELEEGMEAIERFGKQTVKKKNLVEAEILDELQNHECFYTGDISDVVDLFEGTYTKQQIRDVYNKHREANQEYALGGEITAEEREQALKNSPKLNF